MPPLQDVQPACPLVLVVPTSHREGVNVNPTRSALRLARFCRVVTFAFILASTIGSYLGMSYDSAVFMLVAAVYFELRAQAHLRGIA